MTLLVPLIAGLGVLLLYDGFVSPERPRSARWRRGLDTLAVEAGLRLSGPGFLRVCLAGGLLTGFIVAGLTSSAVIALALAMGAAWAPIVWARGRRARRSRRFREAWPDAIATLIASVRAGVSLPEACSALAERGPEDLRPGFSAYTAAYRSSGSFQASLARLADDLADPIADRVVAAFVLAHAVGGTDLVRLLRTLGDFVREDLRVRKEIEARWSWTVTAARVAAAAPWIVLLLMSTRPEAAAAYNSAAGAIVVALGALATLIGYRLMLAVARLPEERRIIG
ncbi:MAG: type II secretion system F family protein [Actinomycetota bacterium]|nr:type II secretion system F family protein [Actinomycetota bacterium]